MKNTLLTERLQQLAGIKSLHEFYPDDTPDEPGYTGLSQWDNEHEPTDADQEVINGRIMGEIFDLININGLDPEDVMEEVATEFDIAFEFGRASGMAKQAGTDAGFDMRGL